MVRHLFLLVSLVVATAARADDPDCPKKWETRRPCLEKALSVAPPAEQSHLSLLLIHGAYEAADLRTYDALLRRHLTSIDSADADVAYLYARYLKDMGPTFSEETLRWSAVAISNRDQWPDNVYATRLKVAYDMRIEASLLLWKQALEDFSRAPSDEGLAEVDKYRTLSRAYLAEAGPCLAEDKCGPQYQVTVEAGTICPELDPLQVEGRALGGFLSPGERACLRAMHDDPFASKRRLQGLLLTDAKVAKDPARFEETLGWHRESFGFDNAIFALSYAELLAEGGATNAPEVLRWATVAVDQGDQLVEKRYPGARARAEELVAWATAQGAKSETP